MDINITGNPGTGNTFQEIHIGTVQNYNPNATTVINNNYGDKQKPVSPSDKAMGDAEKEQCKAEIMDYVAHLKPYVSKGWKNRYETLWRSILAIPEVDAVVYNPGKQKNTTFNRNLIANIIYIMYRENVIVVHNVTTLTKALEHDKDHSVRSQLGIQPTDSTIAAKVRDLLAV
jgi:hypothetical protein